MISTELFPSPETYTFPLPEAKWSKRPFTPSSGTEAVKINGGAASAAGGALAGAVVWLAWHAVRVKTSATKEPMPQYFLILTSKRNKFKQWQGRKQPCGKA